MKQINKKLGATDDKFRALTCLNQAGFCVDVPERKSIRIGGPNTVKNLAIILHYKKPNNKELSNFQKSVNKGIGNTSKLLFTSAIVQANKNHCHFKQARRKFFALGYGIRLI